MMTAPQQQQQQKDQQQAPPVPQPSDDWARSDWEDLAAPLAAAPLAGSSSSAPAEKGPNHLGEEASSVVPHDRALLLAFLGSKGLERYAEKLIEVTDAESVEDLKVIDAKLAEDVVNEAGLKPVPAQKFRVLLSELRGEATPKTPSKAGGYAGGGDTPATPKTAEDKEDVTAAASVEKDGCVAAAEPAPTAVAAPPALEECVAICIDRSGSMGTPFSTDRTRMEAVKQMFYAFRDRTETVGRGAHEIGLVQFDDRVERMLDPSRRLDRFEDIVDEMECRGMTAIYSAVLEGARMLTPAALRCPQADLRVLVLTDGQNNQGVPPLEALRELNQIGAVVDAIIVGDRPDSNLRKIVAATGGECYQIGDLGEGFELLEAEGVVSLRARRGGGPKPPFEPKSEEELRADFGQIQEKGMTRGTAVKRAPALDPALAQKKVVGVQDALSTGGCGASCRTGRPGSVKRITTELAKVAKNDPAVWMHSGEGIHVFPAAEDLFLWRALIEGPQGSPFEGGVFALNVLIPQDYPHRPPQVTFETPVYHCNVSDSGKVCLDLLYDSWSPALTVPKVLEAIRLLLKSPDTDNALRQWIAELTIAHLRLGETEYLEKAQEATRRDAQLSVAGWQQRWASGSVA